MPLFSIFSTCPNFCHFFLHASECHLLLMRSNVLGLHKPNMLVNTSSTAAEAEQEQWVHGRVAWQQRVPEQDEDLIDNDILISLVHERVPLWDTRVPQHSDNVTIWRLWNEVAKAMWDGWDNAPTRVRNAFCKYCNAV
ncbi:uncharacterized protein LOC143788141 [Ranitomeya variabilis]|uniref:uncharacterized protein LOC143788141 n=1 Tax=Ranitomeya variabilis TaxID=490064 RepID=UPI00405796ED